MFWVYVLRYKTRHTPMFYIGQTSNVPHRIWEHFSGRGATATKKYGVTELFAVYVCKTREEALELEKNTQQFNEHIGGFRWVPPPQSCSFIDEEALQWLANRKKKRNEETWIKDIRDILIAE